MASFSSYAGYGSDFNEFLMDYTLQTGTSTAHCGISDRQLADYAHLVQLRFGHVTASLFLSSLLLLSGDIEENPGPGDESHDVRAFTVCSTDRPAGC